MEDFNCLTVQYNESLTNALRLINLNGFGLLYILDEGRFLLGSLSDGDIRRFLINGGSLDAEVQACMNRNPLKIVYSGTSDVEKTERVFTQKINYSVVPVVDVLGRLISLERPAKESLSASGLKYPIAKVLLHGKEVQNVLEAITSTWISSRGVFIQEAESLITSLTAASDTLVTANGTVALQLALAAHRVGPGDNVIIPNLTFAATANAVIACGAKPILADVDPETWNISTSHVEEILTNAEDVRAVIAVDLYGNPCDYSRLQSLTKTHNCYFIVDAAESIGASYLDNHIGNQYCDALTFSFFGNKTITCGEGGSVSFASAETAEYARILRDHGMNPRRKYWHDIAGYNFRMTNLQAAILVAQLEFLPNIVDKKRNIHETYKLLLGECDQITFQQENIYGKSSFWLTSIICNNVDLDELSIHLRKYEVETRPIFYPLSEMPPYQGYIYPGINYSASKKVSQKGLSLPSFTSLSCSDQKYIASAILQLLHG